MGRALSKTAVGTGIAILEDDVVAATLQKDWHRRKFNPVASLIADHWENQ